MPLSLKPLTFDQLKSELSAFQLIKVPHPFMLPRWLESWWNNFREEDQLFLHSVTEENELVGILPFRLKGDTAYFIGSANVCDYMDFIIRKGQETQFFSFILDNIRSSGITALELESLRPDSSVLKFLLPLAKQRGLPVEVQDTDVTLEMSLADDWEQYLATLSTHQRHEVKRKERRLAEAGNLVFDINKPSNIDLELKTLIQQIRISRQDKAAFMTEAMEKFFNDLAKSLDEAGILRIGKLMLEGETVASIMCFDYNNTRYLYNSGYDPSQTNLSVGLLSKVYSIKDAIEQQMHTYDFLKGAEVYKYHLGGREMPVSRCRIELIN
ncbi:cellulose biosynthesis protein [Dehalogenimonas sp. WBC-2]|nr:cellulose biosynthesis protein [Dehalogenimonas sp. WBC-2]